MTGRRIVIAARLLLIAAVAGCLLLKQAMWEKTKAGFPAPKDRDDGIVGLTIAKASLQFCPSLEIRQDAFDAEAKRWNIDFEKDKELFQDFSKVVANGLAQQNQRLLCSFVEMSFGKDGVTVPGLVEKLRN
jgi:hypothetical protein